MVAGPDSTRRRDPVADAVGSPKEDWHEPGHHCLMKPEASALLGSYSGPLLGARDQMKETRKLGNQREPREMTATCSDIASRDPRYSRRLHLGPNQCMRNSVSGGGV